jgi:hypothetical protein
LQCNEHYCIDFKDGKCKYNLDDNELKYCQIADGKCTKCEEGYELSQDGKCSFSKHCFESDLGLCYECEDNYYLGLDNRCTDIEHCAYSDENQVCLECDEKYFYNKVDKNCTPAEGKFEHCKSGNFTDYCDTCQKDYYLSGKDFLCYDNTQPGPFYKCAYSDSNQERCTGCIDDYYLGHIDSKCSAIEGCEMSENENKCLECDEYHCLNLKNNLCYSNLKIKSEEEQFYYNCNQTNQEGTECEICLEGYVLNEKGLCIDEGHCSYKEEGVCKGCKNDDENIYCLNDIFGCIKTYTTHCLECNQILDLSNCTKCESGYMINEDSQCQLEE